jgi:hypothetical protein
MSIYSSLMTGFLLSMVRLFEPYILFLMKNEVCIWFGIVPASEKTNQDQDQTEEDDSLSSQLI